MNNEVHLPLYINIKNYMKNQICMGIFHANDKIPTEKEIMQQFNVSRITVVKALSELSKEGWLYRIPGRGSYVSKNLPESIKTGENSDLIQHVASCPTEPAINTIGRKIGLIIPEMIEYQFIVGVINGISQIAQENKYDLIIAFSFNSLENEKRVIRDLINTGITGLIILPVDDETYNDEILALKFKGFPFVLIDRFLPGIETNYSCSDNFTASQLAVSYLWELGHRKIAICSCVSPSTVTVDNRISGYVKELSARGSMINPALMLTDINVKTDRTINEQPLYQLIKSREATAYIALEVNIALYIGKIAKELEIAIPEDISIITFDNPSPSNDFFGNFTRVEQLETQMGKNAAKLLINILECNKGQSQQEYEKIITKPQLIPGNTTGYVNNSKSIK